MSDGPRIQFDDDSPSPPQQRPFWIALVALFIAIGTFVIAGRDRPASDLEVVDLPTPPAPTTTTVPPTTEPQLLVEDWVPSFDRSLILVTYEDEGVTTTQWRRGSSPVSVEHTLGQPVGVSANADGSTLAVVTVDESNKHNLWLGDMAGFELGLTELQLLQVAFHDTDPTLLAASITFDDVTILLTFRINAGEIVETVAVTDLPDAFAVQRLNDEGYFLRSVDDVGQVAWVTPDERLDRFEGRIDLAAGGTLIRAGADRRATALEPIEGALEPLPDGTISMSPDRNWLIVEIPNSRTLVDRNSDFTLPLTDSPTFVADWSADSRWLVYVSAIDLFRRGPLTRYVFVDADNGSTTSFALGDEQLSRPHLLVVGP